jgi:hypothetical protein
MTYIRFAMDAVKTGALAAAVALVIRCERTSHPCEAGWYINGINPAGIYRCRPVLGRPENDIDDARSLRVFPDDREELGYLHCTGGATPRQDGTSIWCQR